MPGVSPTTSARASAAPRRLSRRTTVAAAAGAFLTAGITACTSDAADRGGGTGRRVATVDADEDPDTRLLAAALASIDEVVAVLTAVRRREPTLHPSLDPLLRLHAAHRDVLTEAAPQAPTPGTDRPRVPRGSGPALAVVEQRERALATRLAAAAVGAESGTFARVLASMAAGVEQHLDVHLVGAA